MNLTCNSTLDDLRILPTSEVPIAGSLTFHELSLIIAGGSTVVAIILSLFLIAQHATHYTKPREQKHIIRILFMVPIYSTASWLSLKYYWHAIYFQVLSDCYEAFAISSFFALLCHYVGPDLHEQKEFFRQMRPVKPWVLPISWFAKCCGGKKGPWRTPASGLTWFNIIWIGIYHYCFIRVAMTVTAVVTQYYGKYCESSNSPVFGHIWVLVIESMAVFIAMYCVVQFYIQLKDALATHRPFLKVLAIKLVIFLSFWQSFAISIGTSTLDIVKPNSTLAYPDIKVGIPSLLLCFEMALFAILHLWAFPWRPYADNAPRTFYPNPDLDSPDPTRVNEHGPRVGGFLGMRALWDAINLWDIFKAFGRGIRWLFVGVKHRHEDISYKTTGKTTSMDGGLDMDDLQKPGQGAFDGMDTSYGGSALGGNPGALKSTDHLPIATQFRQSQYHNRFAPPDALGQQSTYRNPAEERIGLIAHAQPNPSSPSRVPRDPSPYHDQDYVEMAPPAPQYDGQRQSLSTVDEEPYGSSRQGSRQDAYGHSPAPSYNPRNSTQAMVGDALWGPRPPQGGSR